MNEVYVLDGVRTPIGRYGGALAGCRPDDLASSVVSSLVQRWPSLDPSSIDDVVFGDANGAGEDKRNVARMAVLLAGLPSTVPGATVNRLCGSGMEAVLEGARAIAVGDASLILAGGVESMSRAPFVLPKPETAYPRDHATIYSSTLGWRLVNPRMPEKWTVSLGEGAELLAERVAIAREAQDRFALGSHLSAGTAWDEGRFAAEPQLYGIGPVEAAEVALKRAGATWADLSAVELNEAFAAQCVACLASWPELDPAIVNQNGGAIAIGHPLGCSGSRLVVSLSHELHGRGGGLGLAAMCIGVGQGIAVILEGVA